MDNKSIVKKLVKLQVLTLRWVERNTNLRCCTYRGMDRLITSNKFTCTYLEGVTNLKNNIIKYCRDSKYLVEEIYDLESVIKDSHIRNLKFGLDQQLRFTKEENDLDAYRLRINIFMISEMVSIKDIVNILGVTESTVKQACQQQRLLNTTKVGRNWMVHIPECRDYWGIKDTDDNHLYKDWIY